MAIGDHADLVLAPKRFQDGEEAFAGNGEEMGDAARAERVDDGLATVDQGSTSARFSSSIGGGRIASSRFPSSSTGERTCFISPSFGWDIDATLATS